MTSVDLDWGPGQAEQLIRNLYHMRSARLLAAHNLVAAEQPAPQLCVAAADGLTRSGRAAVVVTTLRIHDTGGSYERQRYEIIHDLVITLAVAADYGADCVIYLPIAQEITLAAGPAASDRWHRYAARTAALIERAAAETKTAVTVVNTATPTVRARLADAVRQHRGRLHRQQLARDRRSTRAWITASALTTAGYLPDVVAELTGRYQVSDVLVVGTVPTAGTAHSAGQIAATGAYRVGFLGHLPAPSTDGTARMARARPDQALILADPVVANTSKITEMHEPALAYWAALRRIHDRIAAGAGLHDMTALANHYRDLYTG